MIHRPAWFSSDEVVVSSAPTCGLGRGGRLLPAIDPLTGQRKTVTDPDTGIAEEVIDDRLLDDLQALKRGELTSTLTKMPRADFDIRTAVPAYYDRRFDDAFDKALEEEEVLKAFESRTIGRLIDEGALRARAGHGSPNRDARVGDVPYIKVSDLRAGLVNINPTNRVPLPVAEAAWRGASSGLKAFDLLSPARTSKNIGDFCVLLPGQEQVVLTKEMIVLRPSEEAPFDSFFLLWALTLRVVRSQWERIVFMQTNREDVGKRFHEIRLPYTKDAELAARVSEPFRLYYTNLAEQRQAMAGYLAESDRHHFFVTGAEPGEPLDP